MSAPTVSLDNSLDFHVTVYDSFSDTDKANYFGTLTPIAIVPAKSKASVQLIHETSVLIVSNARTNVPMARLVYLPLLSTQLFAVGDANVQAMAQTMSFIEFITKNHDNPLTVAFRALWKDPSKPLVTPVNKFFAQHPAYTRC